MRRGLYSSDDTHANCYFHALPHNNNNCRNISTTNNNNSWCWCCLAVHNDNNSSNPYTRFPLFYYYPSTMIYPCDDMLAKALAQQLFRVWLCVLGSCVRSNKFGLNDANKSLYRMPKRWDLIGIKSTFYVNNSSYVLLLFVSCTCFCRHFCCWF